jgi:hypothetical protein
MLRGLTTAQWDELVRDITSRKRDVYSAADEILERNAMPD